MESKLYVGNLPYSARDDSLQELFSQAGTVVSANVITDRESGRSKGFAFVEMSNSAEADKAIQMFDGYSLDGRDLRVSVARPREERPRGFGGGDRSGGGGRDRRSGGGGQRRY
jgi:RNA recognition motif-containing protein